MLNTLVGGPNSDSYITVEQAEAILVTTSLMSNEWLLLNQESAKRVVGTEVGPFTFTLDVSDTVSFTLNEDSPQTVVLTGSNVTVASLAVTLNNATNGLTFSINTNGCLQIATTVPTDTLHINAIDDSAYSVIGVSAGTYTSSITEYKEWLLQLAAQLIGLLPIRGYRVYTNQSLDFPRSSQRDLTIVPDEVKEAQAILASLVVLPNLVSQPDKASATVLPLSLQAAAVTEVSVAGIMNVKTGASSTSSSGGYALTTMLEIMSNTFCLPVYLRMKKYLTQFKGGSLKPLTEEEYELLPEVEEPVEEEPT